MFKYACTLVRKFTFPVITSIKTIAGKCSSGIGTCIVINDEGWIMTAGHVIQEISRLAHAEAQTRAAEKHHGLNRAGRKQLGIGRVKPDDIDKVSVWWGIQDGIKIRNGSAKIIEFVDLAIAQLENFDKTKVATYPVFKDPTSEFEPGTSLCRIGFPFYQISTTYDQATGSFTIHNTPLPIFANEGILSRMHTIVPIDQATMQPVKLPFSLMNIETSSPGIKGQSGGPIYDQKGTVWAIQTATTSYELDFETKERQYYHVGIGVHAKTITEFLNHEKVQFQMSAY